jgi:Flp pilus assembly protein TadG
MRSRLHGLRLGHDERGAVAVIVAAFMVVAVGGAAFSVDLGNAWQNQRHLHTATDAAAMAAALAYAHDGNGCDSVAATYVAANDSEASMESCSVVPSNSSSTAGYVTVKASKTVTYDFAGIFGQSSKKITSSTSVQWGTPKGAYDVRPIGLCLYDTHLSSWLNLPDGPTGPSDAITVPLDSGGNVNGCSSTSNWGWLDLSGSGGGSDVNEWLDNGFAQLMPVPAQIQAETGAISSVQSHLNTLVANGTIFPISMYDSVTGQSTSQLYHVVAFAMVQLLDFSVTGNNRYFTFKFFRSAISGTCCGTGPNTGAILTAECAVDNDPKAGQCGI